MTHEFTEFVTSSLTAATPSLQSGRKDKGFNEAGNEESKNVVKSRNRYIETYRFITSRFNFYQDWWRIEEVIPLFIYK